LVFANMQWFIYRREGKYEEGLAFANQQLSRPDFLDNPFLSLNILSLKASLLQSFGQYQLALDVLEEVRKIVFHFGGTLIQVDRFLNTAINHAELGNFSAAREALSEANEMEQKLERPNDAAMILVTDAEISRKEWEAGNLPQLRRAGTQIEQAISYLHGTNWINERAYALQVAGWIALSNNKTAKALEYTQEMVKIIRGFPVAPEGYQYVHTCALWANGRDEEAEKFLNEAYDRVMLVANQTKDDLLRGSWLENVYINRQIIRDWVLNHS
ncbi:MAG: hypothetical protein IH586_10105, partial [Anaerolineaceae bacterium]|nr:hypothetical protein [Anaerolineaceae bacterium]